MGKLKFRKKTKGVYCNFKRIRPSYRANEKNHNFIFFREDDHTVLKPSLRRNL